MKLAVLIMAAGESRRFGSCKLLATFADKPLLQHVIDKALQIAPEDVYLITGAWHREIISYLDRSDNTLDDSVHLIQHLNWQQGLGSSVAYGAAHVTSDYDAIMVLLADQVLINVNELQSLVAEAGRYDAVCAFYQGQRGVPALFNANCFADLVALDGHQGAKSILNSTDYSVGAIEMSGASIDVDTKAQLASLNLL